LPKNEARFDNSLYELLNSRVIIVI
jgi:hypothetical protein